GSSRDKGGPPDGGPRPPGPWCPGPRPPEERPGPPERPGTGLPSCSRPPVVRRQETALAPFLKAVGSLELAKVTAADVTRAQGEMLAAGRSRQEVRYAAQSQASCTGGPSAWCGS